MADITPEDQAMLAAAIEMVRSAATRIGGWGGVDSTEIKDLTAAIRHLNAAELTLLGECDPTSGAAVFWGSECHACANATPRSMTCDSCKTSTSTVALWMHDPDADRGIEADNAAERSR